MLCTGDSCKSARCLRVNGLDVLNPFSSCSGVEFKNMMSLVPQTFGAGCMGTFKLTYKFGKYEPGCL